MLLKTRITKLEKHLLLIDKNEDEELKKKIQNMSYDELRNRLAELIYKYLCDSDPYVMTKAQDDFISEFLAIAEAERNQKYIGPIRKQLKEKHSEARH